jgi:putative ABC transport system permease protein
MLRVALKMLDGDRVKYAGLLLGVAFTAFLVTFASSYLAGFLTNGFALITENPEADVWVMNPAVESVEPATTLPDFALQRVRGIEGVASAIPLAIASAEVRFPNGRFQTFQVIGVDDATLAGLPPLENGVTALALRRPYAVAVAAGGTEDKLQTPRDRADQWSGGPPRLIVPTRTLGPADELLANDHRVVVIGRAKALARAPCFIQLIPTRCASFRRSANVLRLCWRGRRPV